MKMEGTTLKEVKYFKFQKTILLIWFLCIQWKNKLFSIVLNGSKAYIWGLVEVVPCQSLSNNLQSFKCEICGTRYFTELVYYSPILLKVDGVGDF